MFAELIDDIAYSTQVSGESIPQTNADRDDEARLDIATRGFWQQCEMVFFDISVFNPFAKSRLTRKLETVFRSNETSETTA